MFSSFRVVFVFVVLSVMGVGLIPQISVDLMPARYEPVLQVSVSMPQTDPGTIEEKVTAPLENAFSQIPHLKKISSVSRYNYSSISLQFENAQDLAFARFELASIIRQMYAKLPASCSYPEITQSSEENSRKMPLLVYSINAPLVSHQIKKTASDVFLNALSGEKSIEKVEISGAENLQISIHYQTEKLLTYGISPEQILQKIRNHYQNDYLGLIHQNHQQFFVRIAQENIKLSDLENITITEIHNPTNGISQKILLKELASVGIEEQEPTAYFRINGLNSVRLLLYAREGTNQIEVAKTLEMRVQELAQNLPSSFQLILESNQIETLAQEIRKNQERAIYAILILVAFVLLWYRNLYQVLTLFASLAVNLALLVLILYFFKISVHLYTLAGITVSLGLLIDNAVMVLHHITNKNTSRKKKNFLKRALWGNTLAVIAALSLVFFLPEKERMNLTDFLIVVSCNLFISLFVSTIFTPALYRLFYDHPLLKKEGLKNVVFSHKRRNFQLFSWYARVIGFLQRYPKTFTLFVVLSFGTPIFMLPTQVQGWEWYNKTLGNEWYLENIRPYLDKYLGGTLRLFAYNVYENSGYRNLERTQLFVQAEMPMGTTLRQMNEVILKVENYLQKSQKQNKGLEKFVTSIYSPQYAQIIIFFDKDTERGSLPYLLKNRLIALSLDMGGVTWNVYGVGEGFSNATGEQMASFRVEMRGYNFEKLEQQAEILAQKLLAHKRIQAVNTNERMNYFERKSKEIRWEVLPEHMQLGKVSALQLGNALRIRSKPSASQGFLLAENQYLPLMLKSVSAEDFSLQAMSSEIMKNPQTNNNFKLNTLGKSKEVFSQSAIYKENREYIRLVSFEYMGSNKFGQEFLDKKLAEMRLEMPAGFKATQQEFKFWSREQKKRQYELLAIVFAGIFVVCSITFESFRKAFFTLLTIPVSFIGLFLIFYVGNYYFDQGGYASFILLSGTVVAASIFILVEWDSQSHRANYQLLKIAFRKFVPVLITILTSVLGFVPFLLEGDKEIFWFSLALGSIGGLIASLFAVWICLPVWCKVKQLQSI
ncbi:efflux RND transporter permease subunit [Raineya orbicola]|jgi:multidrug efflux pump subunit AcrB|uniref:AcrB/AcrD/AcrF family n=1 Tax=Raineya orbicola TaxID=2016530 RepID=A0A2N3I970_9BACT|nr:efflux RND transporter permease subunit [Raineya orbicola]PKQ66892.1 AcrB/AcrD/AcrF family [Raineya orbicola]